MAQNILFQIHAEDCNKVYIFLLRRNSSYYGN